MVYKLAAPSRLADASWVKPGKVAWEWWNHWGLSKVDFEAGINTKTYQAYIDFAAKNGIEYVILDEGWAVDKKADLFQVVPEIDLKKLIAHAKAKNVGIILWAGYYAFERDLEKVCKHYAEMGVKGFKIDFMDRDDQQMVDFHYRAAAVAAKYKLMLDFHGTYKPTGINRTYPNVINFEAVHGLEQMKWTGPELDQVTYDVTFPFIRMVAGPVDYTQGAMRNATKRTHRGINDEPMSQGTRCRQLAQYVIFESPLNMLCDSPTNYEKEQESTDFISAIPTVWDQTVALDGEIGKYIAIARKKANHWYVGAMTNWDDRKLDIDLSFLGEGNYVAEVYRDGVNANRIASDYKKETITIPANRKMTISMAKGGGVAMKISKK
ncbi:glycoside hydrolase family 97 catalytic domain-containing protein [Pedobacter endophyticus]|uniref:glycoside hydrolase family 97 catalytic domain-containing protein n=1 Tax=Pedobacter endophyticus TaxID=2789740 RepID=UPI003743141D